MKQPNALLITTPTNIRYLTGFVGAQPEEREAYVLWAGDKAYLFTNALYVEEARALAQGTRDMGQKTRKISLEIVEISREKPLSKELKTILDEQGITQLEFEEENMTVAEFKKLKKELKGVKLTPTREKIEEMRMIKREDEIASIRHACKLTDECFTYLLTLLKTGITEQEIALEIELFFRKQGAGLAFSPIVALGKNSSKPHYNPNFSRPRLEIEALKAEAFNALREQDIVLLDFGARVDGYCADMTRMVFIGTPKDEWVKAYEAVLAAQQKAINYLTSHSRAGGNPEQKNAGSRVKPGMTKNDLLITKIDPRTTKGVSGAKVDQAARDVIEKAGLPTYPHSLGHAVGLDIHEAPRLTVKKDQILKPGMVVSVEPGVYIEGEFGIRIEDLVLIKDGGVEVLSKSPKEVIVL